MVAALLAGVLLCAGACAGSSDDDGPVPVRWQRGTLPVPDGTPGRVVVRDVTACGDRWYVVGAVEAADGETRPAAWVSADAGTWSPVGVAAESFYGQRAVLYSVGCRDGVVAVVGARSGGVHGNPRVVTWRQVPDGSLVEVPAPFELYGGAEARNVGRIAGGAGGWLIAGNRVSGAAVWSSPDAAGFELRAGLPGLASDDRGVTWAYDVAAGPAGWVLAGAVTAGADAAVVWVSPDAMAWTRVGLPGDGARERPQRVVVTAAGPVVVGVRGASFGAWRAEDDRWGRWRAVGRFGAGGAGGAVQAVAPLAAGLLVVTWDSGRHGLWVSPDAGDSWRALSGPDDLPAGGDRSAGVAASGGRVVLVVDDGREGRLWVAPAV
ncbi:hypothetical protein AB0M79_19885 [Polymorphospora sp. NPDC051019]|uniref:hypothetical protein n=1 Tax=Polymorphospora sp. NPDC051019 TaxID=3155725 RepID=UPI00341EBC9E